VLHSYITALDFAAELLFECADDNASDVAFVNATGSNGGQDAIEEYIAYALFPLSVSFGLGRLRMER
jgi:hypothetical protein